MHLFFLSFDEIYLLLLFPIISWIHQKTKKIVALFFQIFGHFLRNEQRKCRWKSTTIDWVCPKKSPDNAIWYRKPYEETFNLWNSTLHDRCERACLWNTSPFQVFTLQGYKWKGIQDRKNYSEISALLQIERGSNGYSMFFPFFFILIKSERFQNIFFSKYVYLLQPNSSFLHTRSSFIFRPSVTFIGCIFQKAFSLGQSSKFGECESGALLFALCLRWNLTTQQQQQPINWSGFMPNSYIVG